MKPPPFEYSAPTGVEAAVRALADAGPDSKVLAGGQSLIPMLNMRLAHPTRLVDINRVPGLDGVHVDSGGVRFGALVRQAALEGHGPAARAVPLLRQGLRLVAHPVIRNRGTAVGSLTHADPSAELPAVLALLDGSVQVQGPSGSRWVGADEFLTGPMETCLTPGELAVAAHFPRQAPGSGSAFVEVARRHGDFAVCGVAVVVTLDFDLRFATARAAYVSVAPEPLVVDLTEAVAGTAAGARGSGVRDPAPAAGRLARARVDPEDDIHATAGYRAHLAEVLTGRALDQAAAMAVEAATATPTGVGSQ